MYAHYIWASKNDSMKHKLMKYVNIFSVMPKYLTFLFDIDWYIFTRKSKLTTYHKQESLTKRGRNS